MSIILIEEATKAMPEIDYLVSCIQIREELGLTIVQVHYGTEIINQK